MLCERNGMSYELLEAVRAALEAQDYALEVVVFTDDVLPNDALAALIETTYGISVVPVL